MSLPAADDLFRGNRPMTAVPDQPSDPADDLDSTAPEDPPPVEALATQAARRSSGRVRHDEKMTVYVTADELLDLEHARLALRRHHRLAVDRGRLVREAIAIALADLEAHGDQSMLVQRLHSR